MQEEETDLDELYRIVGYTVITWAMIEADLDKSIAVIHHCCGGKTISAALPRTLKGKIRYMRKALRQLSLLAPVKERGLDLMQQISDKKQQRHDLVHSVLTSAQASGGKFKFANLYAGQAMHQIREIEFDVSHFPEFSKEIQDLETDMIAFAQKLAEDYTE